MSLVAVWSDGYLDHDANWLVWAGVRLPGDEEADRAEILRSELEQAEVPMVPAQEHDRSLIEAVHEPAMLDYQEHAHEQWVEAGYPTDPGSDRVVPYAFPHPAAFAAYPPRHPKSRAAMAGVYCMDTATTIGPGTYRGGGRWCPHRSGAGEWRGDGGICTGAAPGPPRRDVLFRRLLLSEQRGDRGPMAER